jgi:aspartyl-tRNA(Asn)/glutamyl-tRNA(Gln) amidotransferase subunit A
MEPQDPRSQVDGLGRSLHAVVAIVPPLADPPTGALSGLAVAVKDMFDVTGFARGNGNPEDMAGPRSTRDAAVVADLRRFGADVVALAALLEYAAGAQHPDLPEARNPVDPHRTAGGSSGGSAALVGSGCVPVALGTDTGGSIRLPAHYCAVVGFKPSHGTLSVDGVTALAPSLDHVGLLAKDVATTARVFQALTGTASAAPIRRLRIGVLVDQLADPRLERDVRDVVAAAIERLRLSAGQAAVELTQVGTGELDRLNGPIGALILHEAWQVHGAAMTSAPEHFGEPTARLLRSAADVGDDEYARALADRDALVPDALALLDGVDILLGPAAPYVAPEISPPIDTPEGEIEGIFSGPYNVTGQPAIVLPCGVTGDGLPVGLQLAAGIGDDELLLAAAALVEGLLAP